MELVPAALPAGGSPESVVQQRDLDVAQVGQPRQHPGVDGQHAGHPVGAVVGGAQRTSQVHQSAALGIDAPPRGGEVADRFEHRPIGRQPFGVQFGVAAAEVEGVEILRERRLGQRREGDQLGALLRQRFEVVGIIEVERLIAGQTQAKRCDTSTGVAD